MREMNGSGIWRSPKSRGIGANPYEALFTAKNEPLLRWEKKTMAILKQHLQPDRAARTSLDEPLEYRIPVLSPGDRPVLLLDGEELVGAKQNRILNLTVMAPANKTIVIPVSCVEAGRWRAESRESTSAMRTHYAAGRARKAANVSESLRTSGTRHSDQGEVWADISEKSIRMESVSSTGAAAAMYDTHRATLDDYIGAFPAIDNQAGALFCINGKVVGFDLFDSAQTLASLLPKLVQSYALDAIDAGGQESKADKQSAGKLIEDAANATVEKFPAVGEGDDLRLRGEHLSGGALLVDERIIHLCVFRLRDGNRAGSGERRGGIAHASMRRRGRIIE